MSERIAGVFFDLDGTFADTAPDLGGALNRLREEEGLTPVPLTQLRAHTSSGVRGMLATGMGIFPGDPRYSPFCQRFLRHYADNICRDTVLFPGIAELVRKLSNAGIPWGIVTNKARRFTTPLVAELDLASRAACVVSGDSARRPKPHPDTLLMAAALTGVSARRSLYIGDDHRDIVAGHAAGMQTVAVRYGYLGEELPIEDWDATHIVDDVDSIWRLVA